MKKLLIIFTVLFFNFIHVSANSVKITYDRLIYSIAQVESTHNPRAVSPCGRYVGYLQISKGCVDACNNILGHKKYNYSDRLDKNKSIEMFRIIQNHYNPSQDLLIACRIWSEGISALRKKPRHTPYYRKVMKIYSRNVHINE